MFTPLDFGPPDCVCQYCNATVWYEERSNQKAQKNKAEFSICCMKGKVKLPLLQPPPPLLKKLMDPKGGSISKKIRDNIRRYNSMFAFTSIGGNIDHKINQSRGPYVFRISGQNHHRIGSLLPDPGKRPQFAQLYIYDTQHEAQNRIAALHETGNQTHVDGKIVEDIISMLNETNPLAKVFRMARDKCKDAEPTDLRIRLIGRRTKDGRQYNLPTSDEIAGLLINTGNMDNDRRDVVLETKRGNLHRISELHPSYMALQYPILFPYAEDGYRIDIPHAYVTTEVLQAHNRVTQRQYYAFRLQFRANEGHTLILAGQLLHQYTVDAYVSMEEDRLNL